MTIEAVIWDFGGVLTSSPFEAFNSYEAERGLPKDLIRRVNAADPNTNAWAKFERAEIGAGEFDVLFAEESARLGHRVPGGEVLTLLSGDIRPKVVAALEACRAEFKVGCITNNVKTGSGAGMAGSAEKAAEVARIMGLFHHVIESSKAGVRKPDPRIYAMMVEALQVNPANCIYLDDLGVNLKPAKEMGMATIKVVSETQALQELAALTGLPVA